MKGHWASNTRKLNKHYQSNKRPSFFNALDHGSFDTKLKLQAFSTNNKMAFNAEIGEDNMYIIKKKLDLVKQTISTNKILVAKGDIVLPNGTPAPKLYDRDEPLAPAKDKVLGFQMSMLLKLSTEATNTSVRLNSLWPANFSYNNETFDYGRIKGKSKDAFEKFAKPDLRQKGTIDYVGKATMSFFDNVSSSTKDMTTQCVINLTDAKWADAEDGTVCGDITYEMIINNDEWEKSAKQIPVIGVPFGLTNYNTYDENLSLLFTPTVYNSKGEIIDLEIGAD